VMCDLVEQLFTVRNPLPKRGIVGELGRARRAHGVRRRDVLRDAWTAWRAFG